jgi:pSer/pThr/pTyr-binding forkhead associated (FHA) protein
MTDATAAPVAPAGTPYLIHAYEHRAYPLITDRPFTIGRDTACDISVNEVAVSRHHAEVTAEGDNFVLRPTGSTSTILNGAPLEGAHTLQEGDTFMIGTMKFVFTRDRLPVAMGIARPAPRLGTVDDRRPTLTFAMQPTAPSVKSGGSKAGMWVTIAIAIAILAGIVYYVAGTRR